MGHKLLKNLYDCFYTLPKFSVERQETEECRQALIKVPEHGTDIKTPSTIIGHVSSATTLNVYAHVTGGMKEQAAVRIDRGIGKAKPSAGIERPSARRTIDLSSRFYSLSMQL